MSDEGPVMGLEQRGWVRRLCFWFNWQQEETREYNKIFYDSETASDGRL
jgi:hypothetical protein